MAGRRRRIRGQQPNLLDEEGRETRRLAYPLVATAGNYRRIMWEIAPLIAILGKIC